MVADESRIAIRAVEVLLIEDSPEDARWIQIAFEDWQVYNRLHVVTDGEQALEFLSRTGPYADAPAPDLILLDLNLPKVSGYEVVQQLKAHPIWRDVPIVILTASANEQFLVEKHGIPVHCYMVKPMTIERLIAAIKCYGQLRLCIVAVPGDRAD